MSKIKENLLNLESFKYDVSLNSNITYYCIQLSEYKSNLCTIIVSWENTLSSVYQWYLSIHQIFYYRK